MTVRELTPGARDNVRANTHEGLLAFVSAGTLNVSLSAAERKDLDDGHSSSKTQIRMG